MEPSYCMKCSKCFREDEPFTYYFEQAYYCIKCMSNKSKKIREYKFYI